MVKIETSGMYYERVEKAHTRGHTWVGDMWAGSLASPAVGRRDEINQLNRWKEAKERRADGNLCN